MSEETSNAPRVTLPVLPSSGKAEQLRREFMEAQAPQAEPQPQSQPVPAQPPAAAGTDAPSGQQASQTPRQRDIQRKVEGVLRTIYDPEIPVNIYDLGLIYEVRIDDTDGVYVKMTLTAPACPVAGTLPGEVESKIEAIAEVRSANVELVWEPPWSKDRMSESAMLDLGFM
jgi:FeS assembly SUF system protein